MKLTKQEVIDIVNDKSYVSDDNFVVNTEDILMILDDIFDD